MKEEILIVVKTYPNLSKKYKETVCVAGINEKGEWRRLFPVPFRKLDFKDRFKKYDIIEVEIEKAKELLQRKESYHIDFKSIKVLKNISTKDNWKERNNLVLPTKIKSIEEFLKLIKKDRTSIALVKPKEIIDFVFTPLEECRDWERELIEGNQKTLFGGYKSPLDKISIKFSYAFVCDDNSCKEHNLMCEDWELLESWRKWKLKYGTEEILKEKIKQKFFDWMKKRDLHFIIGTDSRWNKPMIIGLYYPPK
jgi:hypothetical protein